MSNALFPIITVPDPVLREKAVAVENVTDEIRTTLETMHNTLIDAEGVGLAANQIGQLRRICIVKLPDEPLIAMVNPEIVWTSEEKAVFTEGCLSIPGYFADVLRPATVRVAYIDENGQRQELESNSPLQNAAIQHEIDHLDGVLFVDYLSRLKRDVIIRKAEKDARLRKDVL